MRATLVITATRIMIIYIDNWVLLHKILRLSHTSWHEKDLSHETLNNVPATTDLNMRKRKHSIWVV